MKPKIEQPSGKLAVLLPGLGAVSTTFIAGVEEVRQGIGSPVGSLTQMQRIRLGAGAARRSPLIRELLPLARLGDLEFGAWDPIPDDAYTSAREAGVLRIEELDLIRDFLSRIKPMEAVYQSDWVRNLASRATHVKRGTDVGALCEALRSDIRLFMEHYGCERAVMIWCGSTERYMQGLVPDTLEHMESYFHCPAESSPLPPSMLYAWAAIKEGVPFANGAPNLTVDCRALSRLALERGVPVAGKDFKTGQTALKTAIAPMLKVRSLGLEGWFSSNILGNRDGLVLDEPGSFRTKENSKLGVLGGILEPDLYPELYENAHHQVRINYYPPAGDGKEAWDAVDLFGWLGYPMELRINFRCRDSILAAPIVLDLALLLDLAQRAGLRGAQDWLGFFFKSPQASTGQPAEQDLFIQHWKLKNALRKLAGEEELTHTEEEEGLP